MAGAGEIFKDAGVRIDEPWADHQTLGLNGARGANVGCCRAAGDGDAAAAQAHISRAGG